MKILILASAVWNYLIAMIMLQPGLAGLNQNRSEFSAP